jgi:hypothetical protein
MIQRGFTNKQAIHLQSRKIVFSHRVEIIETAAKHRIILIIGLGN